MMGHWPIGLYSIHVTETAEQLAYMAVLVI